MVDKRPISSCSYLALKRMANPCSPVEGVANGDQLIRCRRLSSATSGLSGGYCTPGQINGRKGTFGGKFLIPHARANCRMDDRQHLRCGAYGAIANRFSKPRKSIETAGSPS